MLAAAQAVARGYCFCAQPPGHCLAPSVFVGLRHRFRRLSWRNTIYRRLALLPRSHAPVRVSGRSVRAIPASAQPWTMRVMRQCRDSRGLPAAAFCTRIRPANGACVSAAERAPARDEFCFAQPSSPWSRSRYCGALAGTGACIARRAHTCSRAPQRAEESRVTFRSLRRGGLQVAATDPSRRPGNCFKAFDHCRRQNHGVVALLLALLHGSQRGPSFRDPFIGSTRAFIGMRAHAAIAREPQKIRYINALLKFAHDVVVFFTTLFRGSTAVLRWQSEEGSTSRRVFAMKTERDGLARGYVRTVRNLRMSRSSRGQQLCSDRR